MICLYRIVYFILIALSIMQFSWASIAASFADNPINVRSLALGQCSSTLLDSSSFFSNPALSKASSKRSISLYSGTVMQDVKHLALSYSDHNFSPWGLGIGATYLSSGIDGIPEASYDNSTNTAALTGKNLNYKAQLFSFNLSKDIFTNFYIGASLKFMQEKMADASSSGYGIDLGAFYRYTDTLSFGLAATNLIAPNMQWSTGANAIVDRRYTLGTQWKVLSNLATYVDYVKQESLPAEVGLAIEYDLFSFLELRAGYRANKITLGTGLNYDNLTIDYAYAEPQEAELGTTHYVSISLLLASTELSSIEDKERQRKALQEAMEEEARRKALEKAKAEIKPTAPITVTAPTPNITPTPNLQPTGPIKVTMPIVSYTAEIMPLPVSENVKAIEEKLATANFDLTKIVPTTNVTLNVIAATSANYVIATPPEAAYKDFRLTAISPRSYTEHGFIMKAYIDNTGNQPLEINGTLKITNIGTFKTTTANINTDDSGVLLFEYKEGLQPGTYYLETTITDGESIKYQREKYIRRK